MMQQPTKIRHSHGAWKRTIATLLIAILVMGVPARRAGAQVQGEIADMDLYARESLRLAAMIMVSAIVPPLVPVVMLVGMAWMWNLQSSLWGSIYIYDEALVRAWTTENLLQLDYGFRSAISLGPDYLKKLNEDQLILEKKISDAERDMNMKGLTGPALDAAKDAVADTIGYRDAVNAKLDWAKQNIPNLTAKCEAIIGGPGKGDGAFGEMRKHFLGERPSRVMTKEERNEFAGLNAGWLQPVNIFSRQALSAENTLAKAFADYLNAARDFYTQIVEPVSVTVNKTRGPETKLMAPTAEAHLRATVTNDSPDLVFFVKVVPKPNAPTAPNPRMDDLPAPCGEEPGDLFRQREIRARRGWMPLFPKDAAIQVSGQEYLNLGRPPVASVQAGPVGATAPGGDPLTPFTAQLPNSIWFPVEPGDQLELRVATFGQNRRQIRFMDIRGATHRPDLDTIRRNFYYMGYEVAYGLIKPKLNLLYSTDEQYTWGPWEGAWKDLAPTQAKTTTADFYEAPPWVSGEIKEPGAKTYKGTLHVANDHYVWKIPDTPQTRAKLDSAPFMNVKVTGWADFVRYVNPNVLTSRPLDLPREQSQGGTLSVNVEPW